MITQDMIFGFCIGGITAFGISIIYNLIITAILKRRLRKLNIRRVFNTPTRRPSDYEAYRKAHAEGRYYPDPRD